MLPLLLVLLVSLSLSDDCSNCIASGKKWCVESSGCHALTVECKTTIKNALNCPMAPAVGYEYDDGFARNVALPHLSAVYAPEPTQCLKNQIPSTVVYKIVSVQCYASGPNSTCYAYAAYDPRQKSISVVFRGTEGSVQFEEEFDSFFKDKAPFFDNGHVYKYFYDAFNFLWNGGLESAVRSLKYLYPDYKLWVFGHSMGGSISSVFASYIIKTGVYTAENVRLVTFGQPRTGDKDFAKWHDSAFLYSYRVIHHKDPAPQVPPLGGKDEVWHHRYEVWYNNNMTVGMPYQLCQEEDGLSPLYCSNTQLETIGEDHLIYFNVNMGNWAAVGCPKQN